MPSVKAAKVLSCRTATRLLTSLEPGSCCTGMPAPTLMLALLSSANFLLYVKF